MKVLFNIIFKHYFKTNLHHSMKFHSIETWLSIPNQRNDQNIDRSAARQTDFHRYTVRRRWRRSNTADLCRLDNKHYPMDKCCSCMHCQCLGIHHCCMMYRGEVDTLHCHNKHLLLFQNFILFVFKKLKNNKFTTSIITRTKWKFTIDITLWFEFVVLTFISTTTRSFFCFEN